MAWIAEQLDKVSSYCDLKKLLQKKLWSEEIKKYYKANKKAYDLIHDSKFIHMGFSQWRSFKKNDLKAPLKYVEKYITNRTEYVLELACWRWSNCDYLQNHYPNSKYIGLDLSREQLSYANNPQIDFRLWDYHDLWDFKDKSIDISFVIEGLCHSNNKKRVLSEVQRILKPWGVCIIIDGYVQKPMEELDRQSRRAILLTAKSMWVEIVEPYDTVKKYAFGVWLELIEEHDKSTEVLPSMERLQKHTAVITTLWPFSRLLMKIIPSIVRNNYIAAQLMPELIKSWMTCYMVSVFRKNNQNNPRHSIKS